MNVTKKELIIYTVIAVVIIVGVSTYLSGIILSGQSYAVSVKLENLQFQQPQTYPYQAADLRVLVNNTGTTPIKNMTLAVYLNSVQQHIYYVSLPAGTGAEVNLTPYTYPFNGTFQFEAVADPGQLLNIVNRSMAKSTITFNVSPPETPNVYTSIPNGNISNTQTFTFGPSSLAFALYMRQNYNVSQFNQMSGLGDKTVFKTLADLESYIAGMNGAYVNYNDSSKAYVAWIQGTFGIGVVQEILSSISPQTSNVTTSLGSTIYSRLNGTTSICAAYNQGWTKILEYQNTSSGKSCAGVLQTQYNATESTALISGIKANPSVTTYSGNFMYINSTKIGSALLATPNSIGELSLFNNSVGFFSSSVTTNPSAVSSPQICPGLIYQSPTTNVCSVYIVASNGTLSSQHVLVHSTEIKGNYTLDLYSLVNSTYLLGTHSGAIALMGYVNVTGPPVSWTTPELNGCGFNSSTPFNCTYHSFNVSNVETNITLTSLTSPSARINGVSCFLPGFEYNQTVNQTVPANRGINITLPCKGQVIGAFSAVTVYTLAVNYTTPTSRDLWAYGNVTIVNING